MRNWTLGSLGLTLFIGSFLLCSALLPRLALRNGQPAEAVSIPGFPDQGGDAFFVSNGSQELSHIALYHEIGASIENARKADILFFGNSRQQLGLREEVIAAQANTLGLRAFSIAVGHADKTRFALDIIRKHDLRPRIVVASGGPFIFTDGLSPWAQEVLAMSRWEALKRFWERSAAWQARSRLHRYLPRLDYFVSGGRYPWIHYRSTQTGWWRNALEPDRRFPVTFQPERESYRHTLPMARELHEELAQRGALLVLTMVPYHNTRSGHLSYLSRELGVPYVLPSFDGLVTADGSHLTRESARRISEEFWQLFIGLDEVRERLSLDEGSSSGETQPSAKLIPANSTKTTLNETANQQQ